MLVVLLLAVIFLALLALLFFYSGRGDDERAAEPPPDQLVVIPPGLKLRTQPASTAPVLTTIRGGDIVRVVEERGPWVLVRTSEGVVGWADRSLLERPGEHQRRVARAGKIRKLPPLTGQVEERTPLFSGPGAFYPVVGELPAGSSVKVYTRDHDFYAVESQGMIAYAEVDAIDLSEVRGDDRMEVAVEEAAEEGLVPEEPGEIAEELPEPEPFETEIEEEPATGQPSPNRIGVYPLVPPGGTPPEIIDRTVPRYPRAARRAGVEGTVVLRAIVRKDGTVDDVEILRNLPLGLGRAAKEAVEEWRFRPAYYQGQPIDVYYTVTVNFRLP